MATKNGHKQEDCIVAPGEIEELREEFRTLLSFYGSELQSHGALIAGFAVVIFAAAQALSPLKEQSIWGISLFSIFVGIIVSAMIHSAMRFIAYGKLATAMTGGDMTSYRLAKCRWMIERNEQNSTHFDDQLPLAKASVFAGDYFYKRTKGWRLVPAITPGQVVCASVSYLFLSCGRRF